MNKINFLRINQFSRSRFLHTKPLVRSRKPTFEMGEIGSSKVKTPRYKSEYSELTLHDKVTIAGVFLGGAAGFVSFAHKIAHKIYCERKRDGPGNLRMCDLIGLMSSTVGGSIAGGMLGFASPVLLPFLILSLPIGGFRSIFEYNKPDELTDLINEQSDD